MLVSKYNGMIAKISDYASLVRGTNPHAKDPETIFRQSIATTSITKEGHDYDAITNMPSGTARLYLFSGIKEDLLKAAGKQYAPIINSFFNDGGFIDIIISTMEIQLKEKVQIHSLWGDNFAVFYFGQDVPMLSLGGLLYNARNHDWWNAFIQIYVNFIRGTKLAEYQQTVCLNYQDYDNLYLSLTGFNSSVDAGMMSRIPFSMVGVIHKMDVKTETLKMVSGQRLEWAEAGFPISAIRHNNVFEPEYTLNYKKIENNTVDSGKSSNLPWE
jgi:hypothetical protein